MYQVAGGSGNHDRRWNLLTGHESCESGSCQIPNGLFQDSENPSPANTKHNIDRSDQRKKGQSSTLMIGIGNYTENLKIDDRKSNHVSGSGRQRKSRQKVEFIDKVTKAVNQGLAKYPTDYFRIVRKLIPSEVGRRRNFISK